MLTATIIGMGRIGEITMAGNPTTGSSLKAAMVSRVMYRALDGPFVILLEEDIRRAQSSVSSSAWGPEILRATASTSRASEGSERTGTLKP
jgi:hypothetical protein